jgi:hypothetical protein
MRPWNHACRPALRSASAALVVLLMTISSAAAGPPGDGLFLAAQEPPSSEALAALKSLTAESAGLRRWRRVASDPGVLRELTAAGSGERKVSLNLFEDRSVTAVLTRREDRQDEEAAQAWSGHIEGEANSRVHLRLIDEGAVISVAQGQTTYRVTPIGDGSYVVQELDLGGFERCGSDGLPVSALPAGGPGKKPSRPLAGQAPQEGLDQHFIDVVVAFTPAARDAAGGVQQINARIAMAVADANDAYARSGVTQRLRLQDAAEVDYVENGLSGPAGQPPDAEGFADLTRLIGGEQLAAARLLRDNFVADLALLLVEGPPIPPGRVGYCGFAYILPSLTNPGLGGPTDPSFSVAEQDCLEFLVPAHEWGHNMGLAHDQREEDGGGIFGYSRGWIDPDDFFYTIMARQVDGEFIPFFSTPNITHDTPQGPRPIGDADVADSVRTLEETRATIQSFREPIEDPPPPDIPLPIEPIGEREEPIVFRWEPSLLAQRYHLYVFKTPSREGVIDAIVQGTSYEPLPGVLVRGQTYKWWVKGRNFLGTGQPQDSPPSESIPFAPVAPHTERPPKPRLDQMLAPLGSGVSVRPTFEWTPIDRATYYTVSMFRVSPEIRLMNEIRRSGTSLDLPGSIDDLEPGVAYRWKLKAENSVGEGEYSDSVYFTTGSSTAPTLSVGDATLDEPGQRMVFTLQLSSATNQPVSVFAATADDTAREGQDYVGNAVTVTIPANETRGSFSVNILDDALDEDDETVLVNLSNAVGATIGDGQGLGTIIDEDEPPLLSIDNPSVTEGVSGTTPLRFAVSLSAPSGRPVSVRYTSLDGTAVAPVDYAAVGSVLHFLPGSTRQTVDVLVNGDDTPEPNETFFVDLSQPVNATFSEPRGTGTIVGDESLWSIEGAGHFNADSNVDVLWRHEASSQLAGWLMGQNGQPGTTQTGGGFLDPSTLDLVWRAAGTGDFNGDGQGDILWRHATGQLVVWFLDGLEMTSGSIVSPATPPGWMATTTGDFDRDGKTDILWRHTSSGELAVWFMDGATQARGRLLSPDRTDLRWKAVGTGDFNRDGWTDIVFRHDDSGQLVVWLMGPSTLGGSDGIAQVEGLFVKNGVGQAVAAPAHWRFGGTGDFDRDGHADLLWSDPRTGRRFIWSLRGDMSLPGGRGVLFNGERNLTPAIVW